jgi:prepilin-type N-terminal cleavage/methylation domain-containing protein
VNVKQNEPVTKRQFCNNGALKLPQNGRKQLRQRGFSLMELMIALTILGILTVIGMNVMKGQTDEARRMRAFDQLRMVKNGLDEHYMKTGSYPELASWEAMIAPSSPLLTMNFIPTNLPINDPWGNPYEGISTRTRFELKCQGKPDKGPLLGPITITQDGIIGAPGSVQEGPQQQQGINAPAPEFATAQ